MAQNETAEREPEGRMTLGEVIDLLGVRHGPDDDRGFEAAVKAFVITIGPNRKVPGVTQISTYAAGNVSLPEVIGLLELVKRDHLSEDRQAEMLRQALSRP